MDGIVGYIIYSLLEKELVLSEASISVAGGFILRNTGFETEKNI